MLESIRKRSTGVVAWIIVGLIGVAFALVGVEGFLGGSGTEVVAKINGDKITRYEWDIAYERLRRAQQMQFGNEFYIDDVVERQLREQALQDLIQREVLVNGAKRSGIRVAQSSIDEIILSIPDFQLDGQFSPTVYREVLAMSGFTNEELRDDIALNLLTAQLEYSLRDSAFVTPEEMDDIIALTQQTREVNYAILPAENYKNRDVSDEDIQQYYELHQLEFLLPEQVSIEYIALSLDDIKETITLTEEDIALYYEAHLTQYTSGERRRLAHIFIETAGVDEEIVRDKLAEVDDALVAQQDFATTAENFSEDFATANNGGDLGWIMPGDMPPVFEEAAFALEAEGDISAPVQGEFGYHIIKLAELQPAVVAPLAEVREMIETNLLQERAEAIFYDQDERLAELSYDIPDSLEEVGEILGLPVQSTDFFTLAEANDTPITQYTRTRATAFSEEVLVHDENSDVIELEPGLHVVLRAKAYQPSRLEPIDDVRSLIAAKITEQKAKEAAQAAGEAILARLQAGDTLADAAADASVTWETAALQRDNAGSIEFGLVQAAFRLPKPQEAGAPVYDGFELASGNYAVVVLHAVIPGTVEEADSDDLFSLYEQGFSDNLGRLDYELYVRTLMDQMKIKVMGQDERVV